MSGAIGDAAGRGAAPLGCVLAAIVGPTASGKSEVALALARLAGDVEIVVVDSMQVYRGMDIGTAKPTLAEQGEVRHHVIDLVDPSETFSVSDFQRAARGALADIARRGGRAVLVGGTGLYLRAIVDDLELPGTFPEIRSALEQVEDTAALHRQLVAVDPLAASRMEPTNRRRVVRALEVWEGTGRPFSSFGPGLDRYGPAGLRLVGIDRARPDLDERIAHRYRRQLDAGFLDEVAALAARPEGLSDTAGQALGYRELLHHLAGGCALEDAVDEAIRRTRRFARRQQRWFRRDPRVQWCMSPDNPVALAADLLGDLVPCV